MNFDFTQEEKAFFKTLKGALDELEGGAAEGALLRQTLAALGQTPYLGLGLVDEHKAMSASARLAAAELVGAFSPDLYLGVEASARLFGRAVAAFGDSTQRERWLGPITRGETIGALGLSEATTNVINDPLETRGEREGEAIRVTGAKGMVLNAPVAGVFAIVGHLDDGLALFLVEAGSEGLRVGERAETAAYSGALIAPVELEGCLAADLLGPRPEDEVLSTLKGFEDQILTGASLGQMKGAFELAKKHSKTHKTKKGKPIVAFQEVSFQLAEMLTLYQTSQLLAFRAAWAEEIGDPGARALSHCAKVFCTESSEQVASMALSVLGSAGLGRGHFIERAMAAAKFGQVSGTSSELARVRLGDGQLERWS